MPVQGPDYLARQIPQASVHLTEGLAVLHAGPAHFRDGDDAGCLESGLIVGAA